MNRVGGAADRHAASAGERTIPWDEGDDMHRSTTTGGLAHRRIAAVTGGLIGVAALTGCAPAAGGTAPTEEPAASADPGSSAPAASSPSTAAGSDSPSGAFADGTYTADGDYSSPGGPASIGVSVTLKGDAISAVTIEPKADNPTARQWESRFASGIGKVAVGKPIEGLQVGVVSGSSLTGRGFEKALAAIRADAKA